MEDVFKKYETYKKNQNLQKCGDKGSLQMVYGRVWNALLANTKLLVIVQEECKNHASQPKVLDGKTEYYFPFLQNNVGLHSL